MFPTLLQTIEIENVVYQAGKALTLCDDHLEIMALLRGVLDPVFLQQFCKHPDAGKRGLEFVRDVGNKRGLLLCGHHVAMCLPCKQRAAEDDGSDEDGKEENRQEKEALARLCRQGGVDDVGCHLPVGEVGSEGDRHVRLQPGFDIRRSGLIQNSTPSVEESVFHAFGRRVREIVDEPVQKGCQVELSAVNDAVGFLLHPSEDGLLVVHEPRDPASGFRGNGSLRLRWIRERSVAGGFPGHTAREEGAVAFDELMIP